MDFGLGLSRYFETSKTIVSFFGIVNGYDKHKISPNARKIAAINAFFGGTDFCVYDESCPERKDHNKAEFIKLLSRLIGEEGYKQEKLPLIDFYQV